VRACLQAAWREDRLASNPAMKVKPNPENAPRARVLTDDELRRLLAAIAGLEDPYVRAAFVMLVETGARLSEVLNARWEDIDLEEGIWRMPRTKAGQPQLVPLTTSVAAVLRVLPHLGTFVVAGRKEDEPRADLKKPWAHLQAAAGLQDVHIHDLRRTFGLRVTRGSGIFMASVLLRHSDIRVTKQHYAPNDLNDGRKAIQKFERVILPFRPKDAAHR